MAFSPTDSQLFGRLFSDEHIIQLFSDEQFLKFMVEIECVLAEVQGTLGLIPADAALEIGNLRERVALDLAQLQQKTERAGFPVKELVRQLRTAMSEEAAQYVHWGATTQDIMDTACVLQLRDAACTLEEKLKQIIQNLVGLLNEHRNTLMVGRTHGQQALPITFGLKAANWLMPIIRHVQRLRDYAPRVFVAQYGGAAGTLAATGPDGLEVLKHLAARLSLYEPPMPWHTQRDGLVEFAGWLSMVSGSLAKMAQDIILLAQNEVSELHETSDTTRGSSSTMPQKRNPVVSELVIAAARSNAALLSAMHNTLIHEHERGTHAMQMEWLNLPQMVALTATAINKSLYLTEHLQVNGIRMRQNVKQTRGIMLAEAAAYKLRAHMSAEEAKSLVTRAVHKALDSHTHLMDELAAMTNAEVDWENLKDESAYLGASETLINRVLAEAERLNAESLNNE